MSPQTPAPAGTSASCCNAVLIVMDAKPTPFPCGLLRSHRLWSSASEAGMQWGLQESAKWHSGGGEQQPVLLQASGGGGLWRGMGQLQSEGTTSAKDFSGPGGGTGLGGQDAVGE